ncbi:MAG: 30S ribosomal protein S17 [Phycisphaerales bacterium]|nr:30S ribosomal protein S17 [Phycisphaerales bacterium]
MTKQRARRATRVGVVHSDKRNQTIGVTIEYRVKHPKYGKIMLRRSKLHAHDEKNEARIGDEVEVVSCRPLSKTKCWRLLRVIRKAPEGLA